MQAEKKKERKKKQTKKKPKQTKPTLIQQWFGFKRGLVKVVQGVERHKQGQ